MRTLLASILLCCLALAPAPAGAEGTLLEFQAVAHASEVHAAPVEGREGHAVGVAVFRGLAIFPGEEVAGHWYGGTFDFVDGSGRIEGYARWVFDDGSRLEAAYAGRTRAAADGGVTFEARYRDVAGTGRFAGLTGEGGFAGRRVDSLRKGGDPTSAAP